MKQALGQLRKRFQKITEGGGINAAKKQHEKNKLTAQGANQLSVGPRYRYFMKLVHLPDLKCMKNMEAARPQEPWQVLDM